MPLLAPVLTALLCAAPASNLDGVRLAVTIDGARGEALRRSIWVHEPSDAPYPRLKPGFGGGFTVEVGGAPATLRWLGLFMGLRGRLGVWEGSAPRNTASMWDLGVRSRIELALGPVRPWLGVGSSFGNLVALIDGSERQVAVQAYDLTAGLRLALGPVGLGVFVESQRASSVPRPPEDFSALRVGADLTVTFDLGKRPAPSAR